MLGFIGNGCLRSSRVETREKSEDKKFVFKAKLMEPRKERKKSFGL